jgi:hypothetical protein
MDRLLVIGLGLVFVGVLDEAPPKAIPGREDALLPSQDRDWRGLYEKPAQLPVRNLNRTKASVKFFYHAPPGTKTPPELEGSVIGEGEKETTLGVAVWKQDVAFHTYDAKARTLEVYLIPQHLKDPEEVRILVLPLTKFDVPREVRMVRVIYLP